MVEVWNFAILFWFICHYLMVNCRNNNPQKMTQTIHLLNLDQTTRKRAFI
jgi:hypothetical protein